MSSEEAKDRGCALVTGSARGIGAGIVRALAAEGYDVVINHTTDSSAAAAAELAQSVEADFGVSALVVQADVSNFDAAKGLVDVAIARFGAIQVLVNNAGVNKDGLLMRMKEQAFDDVIAVDLKGVFNVTRHAIGPMAKRRQGRIINVSSVSGILGNAGQANYSAAKAGVIGFTKATAREVAPRGITVNAVAPGFIETDMTASMKPEVLEQMAGQIPLGRLGTVEDVAAMVAFLASDAAAYVTGQVLQVDGGLAM